MRTRPTRSCPSKGSSIRISRVTFLAAAVALLTVGHAQPSAAEWEGSVGQRIISTGIDIAVLRPLAALRAGIGAVLFVPAAILASPACAVNAINGADCRPVFEAPYEVLVSEPAEYAFQRKMGEL
ncbi:MAG: hypothetical protein IPK00_09670 [Deltaproteobacteria bacterium]|nr:hypothetical protein [Deltaproteobacteria bacterium]